MKIQVNEVIIVNKEEIKLRLYEKNSKLSHYPRL